MSNTDDRDRMEIVDSILDNIREGKERKVMLNEIAERINDATAAQGVDWWAIEDCGFTAEEWAILTGRDHSTVARNVRRAREN